MPVLSGLDLFKARFPRSLQGARAGLLVHPASVNRRLEHAYTVIRESGKVKLKALFGPQHGILGQTQDNMIEWEGFKDKKTGLRVYSLYGKTRKPTAKMLAGLDALIVDLQDVGARYYTFVWTMALCMEACEGTGVIMVVLDRPNPIGGTKVEGTVLDERFASFVGLHPLPVRHGMTIGELALYLKDAYYPNLDLHVIKMSGWRRDMLFDATSLPWVMPSPNMPTPDTALVYPGMCLLEGTNLSEGRGTTRPFEIFGAPYLHPERLVKYLTDLRLPGVIFRPMYFEPTFQKHARKLCGGAQMHVTDKDTFLPFKTALAVLKASRELSGAFEWKKPPYEYETKLLPIDILAGTDELRTDIEAGNKLNAMEDKWKEALKKFAPARNRYLLYG